MEIKTASREATIAAMLGGEMVYEGNPYITEGWDCLVVEGKASRDFAVWVSVFRQCAAHNMWYADGGEWSLNSGFAPLCILECLGVQGQIYSPYPFSTEELIALHEQIVKKWKEDAA